MRNSRAAHKAASTAEKRLEWMRGGNPETAAAIAAALRGIEQQSLSIHLRNLETPCQEAREVVDVGGEAVDVGMLRDRVAMVAESLRHYVEGAAKAADLEALTD